MGMNSQNPKMQGGKPPTFGNFGFTKHAHKTRVTGGKTGFSNKVSNVKWDKMMQNSGRSTFKTRGGETIKARETKTIVAEMVAKAGGRGLSGKQIKQKLVRDHGMKYKDAGDIARAATYHYYEPPPDDGISPEDALRNVRASIQSGKMAKGIKNDSMGARLKDKKKRGGATQASDVEDYSRLGISDEEGHQASVGGQVISLDDARKKKEASANTQSGEESTFGQSGKETVGVGGSHQQPAKAEKETAAPRKSSMQQVQIKGSSGSTVSQPSGNGTVLDRDVEGKKSSDGVFVGGVVDKYGNKIDLNKKEEGTSNIIEEIRAREAAKKAVAVSGNDKGDELPSEEEAVKTVNVDDEESA